MAVASEAMATRSKQLTVDFSIVVNSQELNLPPLYYKANGVNHCTSIPLWFITMGLGPILA